MQTHETTVCSSEHILADSCSPSGVAGQSRWIQARSATFPLLGNVEPATVEERQVAVLRGVDELDAYSGMRPSHMFTNRVYRTPYVEKAVKRCR